jgi:D-amino-acid dehydrogenase
MARRVCIIGGGVIGLSTAYALVREGFEVDLIDAQTKLASQASFANGGQLSYRYVAPLADAGVPAQALGWMLRGDSPLKLRPRMDTHQWRWISAFLCACRGSVNRRNAQQLFCLALHSRDTLEQWRESDSLDDFAWRRNGKLVTFRSLSSFGRCRQHLSDPTTQRILDTTELAAVEPTLAGSAFVGAIFTPDEEVGDCHLFCLSLAARLRASGRCHFMLGQAVTRIRHSKGVVQAVELGDNVLAVDNLVLCTGHRSASLTLPGLHLPIYPLKGYSLTLPIDAGHRPPNVSITDYDRKVVYARLGQQLRIAAMVDIVGFDTSIDPQRISSMRKAAHALFPYGGDYQNALEWAGMRPATPTGVPIIGATQYQNLWLNVGHGALGFTLACASADLLSSAISGRRPAVDMDGFAPRAV